MPSILALYQRNFFIFMARKYSKKAQSKVEKVMHEFKQGKLKSGKGKHPKVKSRKQAIAIGLSEARKAGAKVPKKKKAKKAKKSRS
jgi:hypothetical protein